MFELLMEINSNVVFLIFLWGTAGVLSLLSFRTDDQNGFFDNHHWNIWFAASAATIVVLVPKIITNLLWPFRDQQVARPIYFILYFFFQALLAFGFLLFFRRVIKQPFSALGLSKKGISIRLLFALRWVIGYVLITNIIYIGPIWNKSPEQLNDYFLRILEGNVVQFLIASFQTYLGIWSLWMPILIIIIFGPFVEEFAFRGLLYGPTRRKVGPMMAILIASFLFMLMHGSFNVTDLIAGLLFSHLYERTHSLWIPVVAHALINLNSIVDYFIAELFRRGTDVTTIGVCLLIFLIGMLISMEILYRRMLKSGYSIKKTSVPDTDAHLFDQCKLK